LYVIYFLGKCYPSIGAPEFILKMPYIPIPIFLSFENPPFDSLHLREKLRQPRIKFCIRNLNFEIFQLQASVVSYTTVEQVVIGDAEFAEQVVHRILAGGGRAVMERGFTGGKVEQAVCRVARIERVG
jgi:hypothetical protein